LNGRHPRILSTVELGVDAGVACGASQLRHEQRSALTHLGDVHLVQHHHLMSSPTESKTERENGNKENRK
jgi:hypothetical protein